MTGSGSQLDLFADPIPASAPPEDTDCGWLLRFLWDGRERTLNEILRASFEARECGLTVHSRASDLRTKHGFRVEWRRIEGASRGGASAYRLER